MKSGSGRGRGSGGGSGRVRGRCCGGDSSSGEVVLVAVVATATATTTKTTTKTATCRGQHVGVCFNLHAAVMSLSVLVVSRLVGSFYDAAAAGQVATRQRRNYPPLRRGNAAQSTSSCEHAPVYFPACPSPPPGAPSSWPPSGGGRSRRLLLWRGVLARALHSGPQSPWTWSPCQLPVGKSDPSKTFAIRCRAVHVVHQGEGSLRFLQGHQIWRGPWAPRPWSSPAWDS